MFIKNARANRPDDSIGSYLRLRMRNKGRADATLAGLIEGVLATVTRPYDLKPVLSKWGSCPTCMSLSMAFFALSLLVLGLGTSIDQSVVIAIGQLASAGFGILVGLHAIFFFARKGEPVAQTPGGRPSNFGLSNRGCGCSSGDANSS